MMSYEIIQIDKNQMEIIKPLWEELNKIHLQESPYFKNHYESFTFSKRTEKFYTVPKENIRIEIIKRDSCICGYCISTIIDEIGELDSIFISEKERGNGLGEILVKNTITWMKKRKCKKIQVSISYGHESVFSFYQKLGFYPKLTYLQIKYL